MSHLFAGNLQGRLEIVVAGCRVQQISLLFNRCKLGIALIRDQVKQRVTYALIGNLQNRLPLGTAGVVTELDFRFVHLAELHLKLVITELRGVEPDVFLPVMKIVRPVIER